MASDTSPPLVIGAGPVGLTMACELARHGVRPRIVDQAAQRSQTSKALGIFPRTLEVFSTMGISDRFLAAGHRLHGLSLHHGRDVLAAIDLTNVASPFPFALSLPQSETERLLSEQLATFGVEVEREVCLTTLEQTSDAVHATLRHADGRLETATAPWLIGCDGAHSTVRKALALEFEGAQYDESFILADVRVESPLERDRIHLFFGDDGILGIFPFGGDRWRIVASIPPESRAQAQPEVTLEEVQSLTNRRGPNDTRLSDPVWMSRFHISHRKVRDYRKLRVFLAGDAAHIHSPAGGQGMNTGIQDAFNLAWKMALVIRGQAPAPLLGSYQLEREPVARGVLNLTDRLTRIATVRNSFAQSIRDFLLPAVSGVGLISSKIADRLCELDINYRQSPLSETRGGGSPYAGERAPDAELRDGTGQARRIFELLRESHHVLLLFLGAREPVSTPAEMVASLPADLIDCYRITRGESADDAELRDLTGLAHAAYGLTSGGMVLVRPDGYIAYRSSDFDPASLRAYLARHFTLA
ncbi:MAG TPA: FAD-dependent monooxygenase [Chthoniobacterales bacterium]|nr:FAD-dependent monooxygenase [Chthoniobacterales bacterium]